MHEMIAIIEAGHALISHVNMVENYISFARGRPSSTIQITTPYENRIQTL